MQTTILNLYYVLLSTGIGLYMYEYTQLMTAFWGIFAYGITSIWILFNWFYLRPKQIKKQQSKLDEIIGKFEMLNEPLNEKEYQVTAGFQRCFSIIIDCFAFTS